MERKWEIPESYGDNKLVLMVRDPWTLFCYWEISEEVENRTNKLLRQNGCISSNDVLRVFDVSLQGKSGALDKQEMQYELGQNTAKSRYINTGKEGRMWKAAIGKLTDKGEFLSMAESNAVETPSHRMSDVTGEDEIGFTEEFYKETTTESIGREMGKSSPSFMK